MLLADRQESKPDWLELLFKNLEEVNRLDLVKILRRAIALGLEQETIDWV